MPRAVGKWALDSGGFTELNMFGEWRTTAAEYVAAVRRYVAEIGPLEFASQQDWMCEPSVIARTGLSVEEHQRRTIANYLELVALAPEIPWMPVIQGWTHGEYLDHVEAWYAAGVELHTLPRVGVGSICRRKNIIRPAFLCRELASMGIKIHAFGAKAALLESCGDCLASADSMAWSYHERRKKSGRQNKLEAAVEWFERTISTHIGEPSEHQRTLAAIHAAAPSTPPTAPATAAASSAHTLLKLAPACARVPVCPARRAGTQSHDPAPCNDHVSHKRDRHAAVALGHTVRAAQHVRHKPRQLAPAVQLAFW